MNIHLLLQYGICSRTYPSNISSELLSYSIFNSLELTKYKFKHDFFLLIYISCLHKIYLIYYSLKSECLFIDLWCSVLKTLFLSTLYACVGVFGDTLSMPVNNLI